MRVNSPGSAAAGVASGLGAGGVAAVTGPVVAAAGGAAGFWNIRVKSPDSAGGAADGWNCFVNSLGSRAVETAGHGWTLGGSGGVSELISGRFQKAALPNSFAVAASRSCSTSHSSKR
jgi:hypothetical protein